jgi:hypothetical protein
MFDNRVGIEVARLKLFAVVDNCSGKYGRNARGMEN